MASLIPGYNYDIFISYRQKDNKGDRWVSEFIEALKTELESTFKEEITVYFDINPHDGLLETHDVDESLKDKLKCLVFIPIISRTYCDPKSFAWVNEFKAFIEQSSKDRNGLKVKLPGGNVANRVLPVQIHDLDAEDKKIVEDELGGHLRGVEFIYKSPGINRPLLPKEENPQENLNHTNYRDQINKVANAIKEVITALKQHGSQQEEELPEAVKPIPAPRKNHKTTIIAGLAIALMLIVLGFLFIPKLLEPSEEIEKSIAVLPFKSLSDDPEKQYQADGMMDAITLHLSKIKDLRVLGRTSTEQYRNPTKTLTAIGKELDVSYLLEGTFQKFGDSVRLIVQLIKTGKEGHIWANNYDRLWKNIFSVQSEVAQSIAKELNAVITPEEKSAIEKVPTANLTAYDFYQKGLEEKTKYQLYSNNKNSIIKADALFHEALKYDSTFAQAYTGLAWIYWEKHYWESYLSANFLDSVLYLCKLALSYNPGLSDAYTIKGDYYREREQPEQAIKEYDIALKYNPNDCMAYIGKGMTYKDYDFINSMDNFLKAEGIYRGPLLVGLFINLGDIFGETGFEGKARDYFHKAFLLSQDSSIFFGYYSTIEFRSQNYDSACILMEKASLFAHDMVSIQWNLGYFYMLANNHKESLFYFKKWLEGNKASINLNELLGSHRIGWAYLKSGNKTEALKYINKQINYCQRMIETGRIYGSNERIYFDLAGSYALIDEKEKSIENLIKYYDNLSAPSLWITSSIKYDPLFESIRNDPGFQQIVRNLQLKYQAEHERVRKWLEENNML